MQFYGVVSSSLDDDPSAASDVEGITAEQFKQAIKRSGMSKVAIADLLDVERSSIYYYERHGVMKPPRSVDNVRRKMGLWLRDSRGNPLQGYAVEDLLNEVARRFADLSSVIDKTDPTPGETSFDEGRNDSDGDGRGRYTGTGGPPED